MRKLPNEATATCDHLILPNEATAMSDHLILPNEANAMSDHLLLPNEANAMSDHLIFFRTNFHGARAATNCMKMKSAFLHECLK